MDAWMRLASHLGISLRRCLAETTNREFKDWIVWLDREWNTPNRSDHYLMQIAREIRDKWSKKGSLLDTFKLKFGSKKEPKRELTKEEIEEKTRRSKQTWGMRLAKRDPNADRNRN